jgi:uncharacterized membrane protein
LPADLAGVLAIVCLTNLVVLLPVVSETPARVVFGLAFVLFVPGYAFVAALFPEAGEPFPADDEVSLGDGAAPGTTDGDSVAGHTRPETDGGYLPAHGIDGIERVALSLGLSIAVVPLVGLVLNFTPWGIRLVPILASLSAFTVAATVVAARRRWELPPGQQFRVPYRTWTASARAELFEPDSRADLGLNVLLVLSIVVATSSVGYAVAVPQQGESFSELYLLTESPDGDLVADDYPTEYTVGEGRQLVVGIGNQEHEETEYTVVVQLQRVRVADNETSVLRRDRLSVFGASLTHNESWHRQHAVVPTFEGTGLRLQYLLYRGDAPETPRTGNAYRENHLWVNVTG